MSQISVYNTQVVWKGEHWGHLSLGNGPEMDFSAPPDAQGHPGVFTPEDGFVAAVNTCIMMMFLWAVERFKIKLLEYECRAEGFKRVEFDRTEIFDEVRLWPVIRVDAHGDDSSLIRTRLEKALRSAQKYSLIANSVKSKVIIEPSIEII